MDGARATNTVYLLSLHLHRAPRGPQMGSSRPTPGVECVEGVGTEGAECVESAEGTECVEGTVGTEVVGVEHRELGDAHVHAERLHLQGYLRPR